MSSSILEQIRSNYEDIENMEKAVTKVLFQKFENVINLKFDNYIHLAQRKCY